MVRKLSAPTILLLLSAFCVMTLMVGCNKHRPPSYAVLERPDLEHLDFPDIRLQDLVDTRLRWHSTPADLETIYGDRETVISFSTLGGDERLTFRFDLYCRAEDRWEIFTVLSEKNQDVNVAHRSISSNWTPEEWRRWRDAGAPDEFLRRGIVPASPNYFQIKFSGLPEADFPHGELFAVLQVTVTDAAEHQISKSVDLVLAKELQWCQTEPRQIAVNCDEDASLTYGLRYGIGDITLRIDHLDEDLERDMFEISEIAATGNCRNFEVAYEGQGHDRCSHIEIGSKTVGIMAIDSGPRPSQLDTRLIIDFGYGCNGQLVYHCFGAIGSHCGEQVVPVEIVNTCRVLCHDCPECDDLQLLETLSTCSQSNVCTINAGSWEHDECCYDHHLAGFLCGGVSFDCFDSALKGALRAAQGFNWRREVDPDKPNCTGEVVFEDYCAPPYWAVHSEDVKYCCSGSAAHYSDLSEAQQRRVQAHYRAGQTPYLLQDARICLDCIGEGDCP